MAEIESGVDWFRSNLLPTIDSLKPQPQPRSTQNNSNNSNNSNNLLEGFVKFSSEELRQNSKFQNLNEYMMVQMEFKNPYSLEKMEKYFEVEENQTYIDSHLGNLKPTGENYIQLREEQNRNWALEVVSSGVSLAKEGKHEGKYEDAIKVYNNALEIYPLCVEAYVARGAAYANMGNLKKAIENFQEALKINPEDVNANKYLKATKEKETTLKSSQQNPITPVPHKESNSIFDTFSKKAMAKLKEDYHLWKSQSKKKRKKKDSKKKSVKKRSTSESHSSKKRKYSSSSPSASSSSDSDSDSESE